MKTYFKLHFYVLLFLLACPLYMSSCSEDEKENMDQTNKLGEINGYWELFAVNDKNENVAFTLLFNADKSGNISTYVWNGKAYQIQYSVDFVYEYDAATGTLRVYDGAETITWTVKSVTSNQLVIFMFDQMLTYNKGVDGDLEDGSGSEDSGEPVTNNYAISDVSDYEFTFYKYGSYVCKLYFTSNYAINASYSSGYLSEQPYSANYEKQSGEVSVVNYGYKDSYGNIKWTQMVLVFESPTSGKVMYEGGINGTFVCKKVEKEVNASAPYYIGGMKFTAKYGGNKWYSFGEQTGNYVKITSHNETLSYDDVYAIYNRQGDKRAVLTIYKKFSGGSSQEHEYTLEFNTNTSGRFTYYHSNIFNTTTYSGEFTLE